MGNGPTARVIRTVRLVLTPVRPDDVEALRAHWNHPDVGPRLWDGGPLPTETVRDLVAASATEFRRSGIGLWAIRRTTAGALVGACGLRRTDGDSEIELLLSVDPSQRGHGLATEAARAVLDHAVPLGGVVAFAAGDNPASHRLLARLGMIPSDFTLEPWVRWSWGRPG